MPGCHPRHLDLGPPRGTELTALIERRGKRGMTVSDNGSELTSNAILTGCAEHKTDRHRIAPGKAVQNRRRSTRAGGVHLLHLESSHGRMRDPFLNQTLFRNPAQARDLTAA